MLEGFSIWEPWTKATPILRQSLIIVYKLADQYFSAQEGVHQTSFHVEPYSSVRKNFRI